MTHPSAAENSQPQNAFSQFSLMPELLQALDENGLYQPTPIQTMAIPALLEGKDMVGLAQTGTGKTAAFVLPLLHYLHNDTPKKKGQPPHALILTPTRELAQQVLDNVRKLSTHTSIRSLAVYGGTRYEGQISGLRRGTNIVVATPGRLEDLMKRGAIDISQITHFILDEADHMLDLGFYPAITRISEQLPHQRQTMLFSATMPPDIKKLTTRFLHEPVHVEAPKTQSSLVGINQQMVMLKEDQKRDLLADWLGRGEVESCVIFVRTKRKADQLSDFMSTLGFSIDALHGDMKQVVRRKVLNKFRIGDITALVATDVAARGIDIPAISHVVNFDLPETPDAYTHRIGRTGRAGRTGTAISFCSSADRDKLKQIQKNLTTQPEYVDADGEVLPPALANPPSKSRKPRQEGGGRRKPWKKAAPQGKRISQFKSEPIDEETGTQPRRKPSKSNGPKKPYRRDERKKNAPPRKKRAHQEFSEHARGETRGEAKGQARGQARGAKPHAEEGFSNTKSSSQKPKSYRAKFKKTGPKNHGAKPSGGSKPRRSPKR